MRVFKNGWFQKFARKEEISDTMLCEAVARAERGQIDADLGSGLIKQRLARPGAGKSGGFRTLVFFRTQQRAVFAFGFSKSDMANLDDADEAYLKKAAKLVLGFTDEQMDAEIAAGRMLEVKCDE
ncbi:hypothetical protein HNR26_004909 [Rhizobium rosettiformans]|uniref:Type II toxin-antitoxin system RelE/ParE family toxin n=2 Tax=Rhizobium rosettiformans TaxID=1368430 RepID=A0A4V4HP73_9HYPH|nr:type II toxin-antitoxin system RelE/ParE family toxin [Rhizobium rosettiformans]MBB5278795.1 hypothetical protein [Rhizobium rosettiformans]THV28796.1 type II toxin-antitoxin system RelE/ParE family toxin [Rhizobium rosettiformans W3]